MNQPTTAPSNNIYLFSPRGVVTRRRVHMHAWEWEGEGWAGEWEGKFQRGEAAGCWRDYAGLVSWTKPPPCTFHVVREGGGLPHPKQCLPSANEEVCGGGGSGGAFFRYLSSTPVVCARVATGSGVRAPGGQWLLHIHPVQCLGALVSTPPAGAAPTSTSSLPGGGVYFNKAQAGRIHAITHPFGASY